MVRLRTQGGLECLQVKEVRVFPFEWERFILLLLQGQLLQLADEPSETKIIRAVSSRRIRFIFDSSLPALRALLPIYSCFRC